MILFQSIHSARTNPKYCTGVIMKKVFTGWEKQKTIKTSNRLSILATYSTFKNPKEFWKHVKEEIDKGNLLKIKFTGTVSPGIVNSIKENGLEPYTEYTGFLSYRDMLQTVINADYLLVGATEKRHLPGKLFEYLRSGNPVIAFGDDNPEVSLIIKKCNAGMMFSYNESGREFFDNIKNINTDIQRVKEFDRVSISEKLSKMIKEI